MTSNLIDFLKENYFKEGWFDKESFLKDPFDYLSLFELKVIETGKTISIYFTTLLLNGDYSISTVEKIKEAKKEIEDYLILISSEIEEISKVDGDTEYDFPFSTFDIRFQEVYSEKLIDVFNIFIYQNFLNLVVDITVQFNFENKFKLLSKNHIDIPNVEDQSYKHHLRAYILALKICRIEHFDFKYTKDTVQLVNSIWHEVLEIKTIYNNEIFEVIFAKIEFIFKKFLYRIKLEKRENRDIQFFLDLSFDDEISIENFSDGGNFKNWEEKLKNHYEISDSWKKRIKNEENAIFRLNKSTLSQMDFHVLTKGYKDINKNPERLWELYLSFQKCFKGAYVNHFGDYAIKVSDGYIFNNYLSCSLETNNYSIDSANAFYKKLKDNQDSSKILNFFPWKVLSEKIILNLEILSKELFNESKHNEFVENIKLLEKVIQNLEESFEWSSSKSYTPFQYTHENCLSEHVFESVIIKKEQKLFFFTSYFLPSNYSHFEEIKNEIKNKKLKLEALIEFYNSIQSIVVEVKTNSDKVNNAERRSIETLAIFSAVALFSIGSIQIFSFETVALDPFVFYNFVLSFGYSLSIFVLLIWIITRQTFNRLRIYHYVVLIVLIISSFLIVNYFVKGLVKRPIKTEIHIK